MLRQMTYFLLGGAAPVVDRAVTLAVEARSRSGRGARIAVSHSSRVAFLGRLRDEVPSEASLERFVQPPLISPSLRKVRSDAKRVVYDATWPSHYAPSIASFAERYLGTRENQLAAARLFLGPSPRPLLIILHGYMSGNFVIEERLWPLETLDAMGFDVALFVLPFHGVRASPARGLVPEFPSSDPRINIDGFFQTIHDLRALITWFRGRGHPRVGLMGMSLGGYSAALAATVEAELMCVIPVVPLACFADFAREQASLSVVPAEAAREHELLEGLYRPVSPLGLAPRIQRKRALVVGARADRVTPITHARKLAVHFGAPLIAWPGGHLLQVGRGEAFARVFELLGQLREA
jgi:pimeloyl-ACP methyl ester carboxylesterase